MPSTPGWRGQGTSTRRESTCSDAISVTDSTAPVPPPPPPLLHRSATDSAIKYEDHGDEVPEVAGSVFYIQQSTGEMNYHVVLQAVHAVARRRGRGTNSARLCSVLINILNCLMDLQVIDSQVWIKTILFYFSTILILKALVMLYPCLSFVLMSVCFLSICL